MVLLSLAVATLAVHEAEQLGAVSEGGLDLPAVAVQPLDGAPTQVRLLPNRNRGLALGKLLALISRTSPQSGNLATTLVESFGAHRIRESSAQCRAENF